MAEIKIIDSDDKMLLSHQLIAQVFRLGGIILIGADEK